MNEQEKKYSIILDEQELINVSAVEILSFMKTKSFENKDKSLEDFLLEVRMNLWKLFFFSEVIDEDLPLNIKCEILIDKLIDKKMIILIDNK